MARRRIILANQCFVPSSLISRDELRRWRYEWEERIYEDVVDENGDVVLRKNGEPRTKSRVERRTMKSWEWVYGNDYRWAALPRGNMEKLRPILRAHQELVVDARSSVPLDIGIRLLPQTKKDQRWAAQKEAVQEWMQYGYGIIKGDPGSGKTIMGMAAIGRTKQRTLILSARRDGNTHWVNQFRARTNLAEIEECEREDMIGVYRAKKNRIWPITVATVQSFLRDKGQTRLVELQDLFGLVLIDEVHEFASPKFSHILSCLNPRKILGVTATPERRDHKHHLVYDLVGPVVSHAKAKQMKPKVTFILTGESPPSWVYSKPFPGHYRWIKTLEHLASSDRRYTVIMNELLRDIKAKRVIATVSTLRKIPQRLHAELTGLGIEAGYVDGDTRKREDIYQSVRDGDLQVLCAGKVLNALVDIPNLNCVHVVTPVNNKKDIDQMYGRGNRWMEGKLQPWVKHYIDQGGQLSGAFRNCVNACEQNGWEIEVIDGTRHKEWKDPS